MYGFCFLISDLFMMTPHCADRPVCDNRTVAHSKIAVSASSASIVDCFLDANPPATQVPTIHLVIIDPNAIRNSA